MRQTLDLSASFGIHSGGHTHHEDGQGHQIWAQKKEGASDSGGCPGREGVSAEQSEVPRECHAGRRMAAQALFFLWGAMTGKRGRVAEQHAQAPQCILGSSRAVYELPKPIKVHQESFITWNPAHPSLQS